MRFKLKEILKRHMLYSVIDDKFTLKDSSMMEIIQDLEKLLPIQRVGVRCEPMKNKDKLYTISLIDFDKLKKEQELIKAEYKLECDKQNTYWIGRVKFLKEQISSCDDCINALN